MPSKAIAVSVITVWLALFGVEFFEELGVIQYPTAEMDRAMDETLDSFGSAIVMFDDSGGSTLVSRSVPYEAVYSLVSPNLSFGSGRIDLTNGTQFLQKHLKINKFLQVFLI